MDALQMLLAQNEIRGLKARYCRFLDTKDWEGLTSLFLEDAVLDVEQDTGNPPLHGRAAIIEQIRIAVVDAVGLVVTPRVHQRQRVPPGKFHIPFERQPADLDLVAPGDFWLDHRLDRPRPRRPRRKAP